MAKPILNLTAQDYQDIKPLHNAEMTAILQIDSNDRYNPTNAPSVSINGYTYYLGTLMSIKANQGLCLDGSTGASISANSVTALIRHFAPAMSRYISNIQKQALADIGYPFN